LFEYIEKSAEVSLRCKEYVIVTLLVIASAIIGNKRYVRIHDCWSEPVHLRGAIVGAPGCKKTASMGMFYDALKPLEEKRLTQYDEQMKKYRA
jgi:hypothetical protein